MNAKKLLRPPSHHEHREVERVDRIGRVRTERQFHRTSYVAPSPPVPPCFPSLGPPGDPELLPFSHKARVQLVVDGRVVHDSTQPRCHNDGHFARALREHLSSRRVPLDHAILAYAPYPPPESPTRSHFPRGPHGP